MLAVQVQYWDLQERKRHNVVTERQGDRNLNILEAGQKETARHNLVSEELGWANLDETKRHNIVVEGISRDTYYVNAMNADTNRFNAETNRMNAATNAAMVPIAQQNADTNRLNVENTQWYNTHVIPIQQQQADTQEMKVRNDFALGVVNTGTQQGQLSLGYDNLNVKQSQVEADIYYKHANIDLSQQQLDLNKKVEIRKGIVEQQQNVLQGWRNLNGTIEAAGNLVH